MNFDDPRQREVFFEVHRDLPREGPGNEPSTRRALELVTSRLPRAQIRRVLDVACGPGMQTLDLARLLPEARILAVDLHFPFVAAARRRARGAGGPAGGPASGPASGPAGGRISVVRGDMRRLPVRRGAVDLVWCEGAAYLMGVPQALAAWRDLLPVGGCVAFTEPVWLRGDVPPSVAACWAEYPAMTDADAVVHRVERAGFEALTPFVLPAQAWFDDYYDPMAERLGALRSRYADDPRALAVLDECREEIEVYRSHGDCYGYAFFVGQARP